MARKSFLLALCAFVAGCTPLASQRIASTEWRTVANEGDRDRLRDWRASFEQALSAARAAGFANAVDAEGPLLELDSALGGGLPNGRYRCRTIKLDARRAPYPAFIAYPAAPCRVGLSGAIQGLTVEDGAQRPSGFIFPADRLRSVFLGGLSLADEPAALRYGTDPDRDLAGWVERIGEARWRILLPAPRLESRFDVIELVPEG